MSTGRWKKLDADLLKPGFAQKTRYLTGNDADRRASHEPADRRRWDELDDPTETEEANAQNDEATDEGNGDGYLWTFPSIRVVRFYMLYNLGDSEGHDRDGTDGDIFGCSE